MSLFGFEHHAIYGDVFEKPITDEERARSGSSPTSSELRSSSRKTQPRSQLVRQLEGDNAGELTHVRAAFERALRFATTPSRRAELAIALLLIAADEIAKLHEGQPLDNASTFRVQARGFEVSLTVRKLNAPTEMRRDDDEYPAVDQTFAIASTVAVVFRNGARTSFIMECGHSFLTPTTLDRWPVVGARLGCPKCSELSL